MNHPYEFFNKCKKYSLDYKPNALDKTFDADHKEAVEFADRIRSENKSYIEGCIDDTLVITIKGIAAGM